MFEQRLRLFQQRLDEAGIDVALITDDDNVYYLTGYYDYLHMEFGRPTILVVPSHAETLLVTPSIDLNAARKLARVSRIAAWNDGVGNEWRDEIPAAVKGAKAVAIEPDHMPPPVRTYVNDLVDPAMITTATPILADMRMIKSPEELQMARHAGQVANAMMQAGRATISDGVPEYEVALATSDAGTRKAAELLKAHYSDTDMSPNMHFLQIMASGEEIIKTHHRATNRIMKSGEPVFLCFCGMTNFHRFKLGFDRTFWIDEIADRSQADIYEVAVASQKAALDVLRAGVTAEQVHAAYAEVIEDAGFDFPFRCGRATGFSFLEKPQLVTGDKTVLQSGMVLAVDGSVSTPAFRAQVGDSFIVTENGYEAITTHPKKLSEMIL
jgi:Xaa-Pro aminopeptidase